jgi:hypothetical protein
MAHIAVLGQMCRGSVLAVGGHHLVRGITLEELGIEFAAEFAGAAGAGVEAVAYGSINVLHCGLSPFVGKHGFAGLYSRWRSKKVELAATRLFTTGDGDAQVEAVENLQSL